MAKEKKGFAESVNETTDKIDEAAVKVETFVTKTVNFFKTSWKWLLSDVVCIIVGSIISEIL